MCFLLCSQESFLFLTILAYAKENISLIRIGSLFIMSTTTSPSPSTMLITSEGSISMCKTNKKDHFFPFNFECLLYIRYHTRHSICIILFNAHDKSTMLWCYCLHLTSKETEFWKDCLAYDLCIQAMMVRVLSMRILSPTLLVLFD